MRAPLSGSTGSGDATGEGSRDASTLDRDCDSDEGRTLSGSMRATGLRSARRRAKRQADLDEVRLSHTSAISARLQAVTLLVPEVCDMCRCSPAASRCAADLLTMLPRTRRITCMDKSGSSVVHNT